MAEQKRERSFGLSVGAACGLLVGYSAWRHHSSMAWTLGGIASMLLAAALVRPSILRWPSRLWWKFAATLGWVNSRVVLSLLFFFIFTPFGLAARLRSWDPLRRRWPGSGSGWEPVPVRRRNPKHYEWMS